MDLCRLQPDLTKSDQPQGHAHTPLPPHPSAPMHEGSVVCGVCGGVHACGTRVSGVEGGYHTPQGGEKSPNNSKWQREPIGLAFGVGVCLNHIPLHVKRCDQDCLANKLCHMGWGRVPCPGHQGAPWVEGGAHTLLLGRQNPHLGMGCGVFGRV